MTDELADVGKLHVTFEYPNRVASQKVMQRVFAEVRYVGSYHYMTPGGPPRITVITEDKPPCREQLAKARRLLSAEGGRERAIDDDMLERFRERRRRKALIAARGEGPAKSRGHHPHGAYLQRDGSVIERDEG